jgi:hypothetical protein
MIVYDRIVADILFAKWWWHAEFDGSLDGSVMGGAIFYENPT